LEAEAMATINTHVSKAGVTTYRVRIQRKGQQVQTATFPTLKEAKRYATMVEGDLIAGRHFPQQSKHTLAALLDRYTLDVMPRKTPETQRSQMPVMHYWQQTLGHMLLSDIQPSHIIACRDAIAKAAAPATVVKYLMVLSHAFTTAMTEYQWTDQNPCRLVRKPTLPPGRVRYLSDDERNRLLVECKHSQNTVLHGLGTLALYTGLRRSSLFALTIHNTDITAGRLTLDRTKNGSRLTLPLVGEALTIARALSETSRDGYLFPRGKGDPWCHYRTAWDKALKRAKLDETFSFHALRHCTGSYLVQAGIPLYVVSHILAHTKITSTQRYAHLHIDNLRDALETLSQRLSA
jgi:integrase